MSSEQTPTSEVSEASAAEEPQQQGSETSEGTDWRAENTRLRQQLKKAQDLNREAMPYVQLAMTLQSTPGGDKIVEKLQKGEPLTAAQEKKLEKAQEGTGTEGFSEEQFQKYLEPALEKAAQNFEQRLWESRKAEKTMEQLHTWASKEYPGYEELKDKPEWNQRLGVILNSIQRGELEVPDEWDPYKFAINENYQWLKAKNPDIGKAKPSKKSETDRRAAISQSSVQAGGVPPEDSEQLPEYARLDTPRKSFGGGRPFGSLRRS